MGCYFVLVRVRVPTYISVAKLEKAMEPLVTSEEIAAHLALKAYTVRKMTRENEIPHVKIGSVIRYRLSEVMAHFESGRKQKA